MNNFSTKEKKHFFSLMIIPPSGKKSLSLRFPIWVFYLTIALFLILFSIFIFSIFLTFKTSVHLAKYKQLKQITLDQDKKIQSFNNQINELAEEIKTLFEKEEEIETELGTPRIKTYKKKRRTRKKYRKPKSASRFEQKYKKILNKNDSHKTYAFLKGEVSKLKKVFKKNHQKVQHNRNRFASTPSIWPIYGRIRSGFGIRYHPIFGRKIFHKGLDIPAWRGAPVKATAEGIVAYAGWSKGGFGFIVIIDHDYGYRTIYGHCSQILVRRRQQVKKGQIIAQVGSSGLSTGSHLHYEIQRWRRAIDPKPYLDLDMFTASTRIW